VIVREAELRETLVRLALEEHVIAEGAGALALAAGRRVSGKRKCAVVSGGNIDAALLSNLLADVRPHAPRKPRRRATHESNNVKPARNTTKSAAANETENSTAPQITTMQNIKQPSPVLEALV
jgi:threonine dehydratase